jgi:hypothetical protein
MIEVRAGDTATARQSLYQALSLSPRFHPVFAGVAARTIAELGSKPPRTLAATPVRGPVPASPTRN